MTTSSNININRFQLSAILDEEQKEDFNYLLEFGVNCNGCGGNCSQGIEITEMFLDSRNDIMIRGNCKACNGKVARVMEFGEDKEFYKKANSFRKSIGK